jgi:uncharacterized protein with ACT and thioredoxin-like domain
MRFYPTQTIINKELCIPYQVRANFNIYENDEIFLSMNKCKSDKNYVEFIISPIKFEKRNDLWKIEISFHDRVGIIKEFTDFLRQLNIDIVSFKSYAVESGKFLFIKAVIDTQFYYSSYDKDPNYLPKNETLLSAFEAKISSVFIEDLLFHDFGKPFFFLYKNSPLQRSVRKLNKRFEVKIKESVITLNEELYNETITYLEQSYHSKKINLIQPNVIQASIISEPDNNFFRVFIYYKNAGIVHLRIKTENTIGSISKISSLFQSNNYNIIQIFTRNFDNGKFSLNDFLIEAPIENIKTFDDQQILRFFGFEINKSEELSKYVKSINIPRQLAKIKGNKNYG